MIVGMLRWCVQEAMRQPGTDLMAAAALCESMRYESVTRLDLDLMDAITKPRARWRRPARPAAARARRPRPWHR